MKIAQSLFKLGRDSIVNSYLVEEGGEVTIIDAGVPGFYNAIPRELDGMGLTIANVRAIVLTHGHTDHIGFAERFRRKQQKAVWVHELDAKLARGKARNPAKGTGPANLGPLLGFIWWSARHGGLAVPKVHAVSTFGDGATLDLPGSPRVIAVPGHTPGSAALHVSSLKALFVGDAFATYAVTTGKRGPQIAPFTADSTAALASLDRLAEVEADYVLPGHGDVWTDGVASAIAAVRAGA